MGTAAFSAGAASLILFGVFFGLLALRVPVAFALGLACLPMLIVEEHLSPMTLVQETFNAYNSFILLAVPFFLLTANLMNVGGITDRLVRLSRAMVGHFPGSLAQMNVLLSIFFAGISGSSTADAASQGKIFIEAQIKEGYDRSFSIAITAVSAVLAVIIPPSILMIVWGGVLTVSIGALFLAGVIPGLLLGVVQMATVHVYAKLRNYPTYPRSNLREFLLAAAVSALTVGFFWISIRRGILAQRARPMHNPDDLLGQVGDVRSALEPVGSVYVGGELWSARSETPLAVGTTVRVRGQEGLVLLVDPVPGGPAAIP